jgi:hypothetical protein
MHRAVRSPLARRGATLIEYAVLAGLITLALATVIMIAGQRTARSYDPGANPRTTEPQHLPADSR